MLRLEQEQAGWRGSSMEATCSDGRGTGTNGKLAGNAPRVTSASQQRKAFSILADTYISCLVDLVAPDASDVDTFVTTAPSTPRYSYIAPRITSLTGMMSASLIPIARADGVG